MNLPEKSNSLPNLFAENAAYAEATLRQIEKDFMLQGMTLIIPSSTMTYTELIEFLGTYIDESGLLHSPKFIGLLYQLDINEAKMRKLVAKTPLGTIHLSVADEIIKRCFTKIYWRLNSQ